MQVALGSNPGVCTIAVTREMGLSPLSGVLDWPICIRRCSDRRSHVAAQLAFAASGTLRVMHPHGELFVARAIIHDIGRIV